MLGRLVDARRRTPAEPRLAADGGMTAASLERLRHAVAVHAAALAPKRQIQQ